jgi:HAD superfamily hydrolase (TIGR01509 family)
MLKLVRPRAVIFDMDGLLLDSERIALECFETSARELGLPWDREFALSLVGITARESDRMMHKAFGEEFPVEQHRQRCSELYDEAIRTGAIVLKPFARELLDYLNRAQIPCAVATSTQRVRAEVKLHRTQILPCFKALACGDEVTRGKPAPDIFELAARRVGVEPRDCLALEDSNPGIRAAVSASMPAVMVPDLLTPDADVRRYGVPVVDSLKDVLVALMQ